ncbi:MAG: OstA-like protein [Ignavibacteriaceae bacterium]|nr:OstA-like protein [Ignavibacteriaceae bacterium]
MKIKATFFIILLFAFANSFAQQQYITITGDKFVNSVLNGEMVREVINNVVLTQGNVRITCNHATQYLSRNEAELDGNVVATQDTLVITTSHGFYYGDERRAQSNVGVKLYDKKVTLTADTGVYYFDLDKAIFQHRVKLVDTASTLTSRQLVYFKKLGKSISVGNVKIIESKNIIYADTLVHFRDSRVSIADSRVKINSESNNSIIYGNHLEDYPDSSYTMVTKDPLFIQIDSSYVMKKDTTAAGIDSSRVLQLDTLVIRSLKMEAYRDTINIFKAEDSVQIVRGNFSSKNDFTKYFRGKRKIITFKLKPLAGQPVIWYDNSQLTGDSVAIILINNKIDQLEVFRNSFILSQNDKYKERYDQISGNKIIIHFDESGIHETEVFGGVHSIYYLYDNNEANGLSKSSSEHAKILFVNKRVDEVKLYSSPTSEFYPENKVTGSELSFTLPGYVKYNNRPVKNALLENYFGK